LQKRNGFFGGGVGGEGKCKKNFKLPELEKIREGFLFVKGEASVRERKKISDQMRVEVVWGEATEHISLRLDGNSGKKYQDSDKLRII